MCIKQMHYEARLSNINNNNINYSKVENERKKAVHIQLNGF